MKHNNALSSYYVVLSYFIVIVKDNKNIQWYLLSLKTEWKILGAWLGYLRYIMHGYIAYSGRGYQNCDIDNL